MAGPHDSIVKSLFSNTEDAASALASALPRAIAERIDWTSLKQANLSLVDRKLREFYSDIVFTARLDGLDIFLYVLLEHQSTADHLMPFRMLRYTVLLWDSLLKDNPKLNKFPVVLPLVLHHGKSRWSSPLELSEIIDAPDGLRRLLGAHLPSFRFFLDDLSATDDQALRQRSLTTMMLACMVLLKKSPGSTDLLAELRDWMDVFEQIALAPNGLDALRLLLEYIAVTTDADPDNVHQFATLLGPAAEEAYMTAAEKIALEGRKEGLEQGLEQGLKEGQAQLLVRQLTLRFGTLSAEVTQRVHSASDTSIALWAERVLTAGSLDEVFAG